MVGRAALRAPGSSESFGVNWLQQGEGYQLRLTGPLGVLVAEVLKDPEGVSVTVPGEGQFYAATATQLVYQHTGMYLPVDYMPYWLQGKKAPGLAGNWQEDTLHQAGWQIQYAYDEMGRPKRIRMTGTDVRLTIAVQEWQ